MHGHAIIYTDIALKGKYSLCKTIEDVERELSVESSYAKGEPLDTKGATELAERLAAPLGH